MQYKERMEIGRFIKKILKKWWLVLIVAILFGFVGYFVSKNYLTPMYESKATIFIGKEDGILATVNLTDLQIGEQLVTDYSELAKTDLVLLDVLDKLELSVEPSDISKLISIELVKDSRFMRILVTSSNAEFSKELANTISEVLKDKAEDIVGARNINIVDYAKKANKPVSPNIGFNAIVSAMIGIFMVVAIMISLILLDNKVKSSGDIEIGLSKPCLGVIPVITDNQVNELIDKKGFQRSAANAYRGLRTNLHFVTPDKENKVVMFTSDVPAVGKTTTISNVALSYALSGKKVLMIDSDLRRPQIHAKFNLSRNKGLSDILVGRESLSDCISKSENSPNLDILTAGSIPPNPQDLLMSNKLGDLIKNLRPSFDYIFIDTPPLLFVSDALNYTNLVDAVVLVAGYNKSKVMDLKQIQDNLSQVGLDISGVIINRSKIAKKYNYDY